MLDIACILCKNLTMSKRTKHEKRARIHDILEGYRRFDFDYVPSGDNWFEPDETFKYRQNFIDRAITLFWRTFLFLFGGLLIKLVYGARVTGRKNLKKIKRTGAVSICNHISYLDTLFVRQATGNFRSYHTMAKTNNKTGLGGHIIRHGGMLPFSSNFTANKNLINEVGRLLSKKKIVNIYAEKAMWLGYQKPRPLLSGAFFYAVKYNVPVLPVFCTFTPNKKGRIKKLRINILEPVFPDEALKKSERTAKLLKNTEAEWKSCYESAYEKPLEYLPDRRKRAV